MHAFILIMGACALLWPSISKAAEQDVTLFLRPHCLLPTTEKTESVLGPVPGTTGSEEAESEATCPKYDVEDPQTLRTAELQVGDILDMDLVIENPSGQPINRLRSWLTYDPNILLGDLIEITDALPVATPGESNFSESEGYVKIETSAEEGKEPTDTEIVIARIQFRVKSISPLGGTHINFFDVQRGGHTVVMAKEAAEEEYILKSEPGVLHIVFPEQEEIVEEEVEAEPVEEVIVEEGEMEVTEEPAEKAEAPPVTLPPPEERTAFVLLQIQNVRVTTEGSTIFLSWDPLVSSQLKGYNVYYGTVSGEYIQRKSITPDSSSLTLRALPTGTHYYFAIRAISNRDEESAFSQEVAVTVGDPTTSTALLVPGQKPLPPIMPKVDGIGEVPGETGMSSTLTLLLIASAVIGTIFAWRRQLIVDPA